MSMEQKKSDIKLVLRGTSAWQSQKMRFLSPCISKFQNTKEERFSNYLRLSELNVHNDFTGAIESDINLSWEATVRGTHKKGVSCHLASSVLERHLACESWKSFRSLWIILLVFCVNSGTILMSSSMAKVVVILQLTLLYTLLVIWSSDNIRRPSRCIYDKQRKASIQFSFLLPQVQESSSVYLPPFTPPLHYNWYNLQ